MPVGEVAASKERQGREPREARQDGDERRIAERRVEVQEECLEPRQGPDARKPAPAPGDSRECRGPAFTFYSNPIQSIPIHSIPFQSIPFHSIP
jgi:hypothetical protein